MRKACCRMSTTPRDVFPSFQGTGCIPEGQKIAIGFPRRSSLLIGRLSWRRLIQLVRLIPAAIFSSAVLGVSWVQCCCRCSFVGFGIPFQDSRRVFAFRLASCAAISSFDKLPFGIVIGCFDLLIFRHVRGHKKPLFVNTPSTWSATNAANSCSAERYWLGAIPAWLLLHWKFIALFLCNDPILMQLHTVHRKVQHFPTRVQEANRSWILCAHAGFKFCHLRLKKILPGVLPSRQFLFNITAVLSHLPAAVRLGAFLRGSVSWTFAASSIG